MTKPNLFGFNGCPLAESNNYPCLNLHRRIGYIIHGMESQMQF